MRVLRSCYRKIDDGSFLLARNCGYDGFPPITLMSFKNGRAAFTIIFRVILSPGVLVYDFQLNIQIKKKKNYFNFLNVILDDIRHIVNIIF